MNPPSRGLPILTPLVLVLAGVEALLDVVLLAANVMLHVAQQAPNATDDSVLPFALAVMGAALFELLILIVGGITFLVWTYWAAANVRSLGAQGLKITPGWAVGWYFVPFANLVMPHNALQEIARASVTPLNWAQAKGWALISTWWVLRLVVGFAGGMSGQLATNPNLQDVPAEAVLGIDVVLAVLGLVVLALAAWMVRSIDVAQAAAYDSGVWQNVPIQAATPMYGKNPYAIGEKPYTVTGDVNNPYRSPGAQ